MNRVTTHQPHILVVDDEFAIRITLDALLRRCGYRVTLATSGEHALAAIAAHMFDLVLTDLILGGISGIEVAKHVRATQPDAVILLMTGSDQLFEVESSGYPYVHKTAPPQAVLAQIAALLPAQESVR